MWLLKYRLGNTRELIKAYKEKYRATAGLGNNTQGP